MMLNLANVLNGACLTESQLGSLGITDVLAEAVDNTGDDVTCKTETKVCVEPTKLKEQIKAILKGCKDARNNQMKKVGERVEKSGKKMKELAEAGSEAETDGKTKKGGKFKRPPKDKQKQKMKKFKEKCTEENCSDLKKKFTDMSEYKECFKTISQAKCGTICGLVGVNGSENVKTDSTGQITGMRVSNNTAEEIFDKCAEFFQTQCVVTNMYQTSEEMTSDTQPVEKPGQSGRIRKICAKIEILDTCKDDVTKCDIEAKKEFIEAFIQLGKDCGTGEPDENFEAGDAKLNELVNESEGGSGGSSARLLEQFKERLLAEATANCSFEVTSNGYDVMTGGKDSGIDYSEFSENVSTLTVVVVGLLSILLK